ncbi:hypothetical protein ACDY96_08320 [Rhizobium mongolense]|uniref:hypothetical protein n=1 Tax=Rhizobium TaxID=379 RepID=UPI0024B23560|nr:hypothetical protein [Rhizobium sp. CC1099]WFU88871.1 hypothetical protein QA644_07395 [Rhizobium sp. CC1099]
MARITVGTHVEFNSQAYVCFAIQPFERRNNGRVTEIARWASACPECGAMFEITTTVRRGIVSPNRRCERHRKPGIKVRMDANAGGDGPAIQEE